MILPLLAGVMRQNFSASACSARGDVMGFNGLDRVAHLNSRLVFVAVHGPVHCAEVIAYIFCP